MLADDVREKLGLTPAQMEGRKAMHRIRTKIQDNPKFWDSDAGTWTEQGAEYMALLARLSLKNRPASSRANGLIGPAGSLSHLRLRQARGQWAARAAQERLATMVACAGREAMFGDENLFDLDFEERPRVLLRGVCGTGGSALTPASSRSTLSTKLGEPSWSRSGWVTEKEPPVVGPSSS